MDQLPENAVRKSIRNPDRAVSFAKNQLAKAFESQVSRLGRSLYDHDWDCAVILDACRYDLALDNEDTISSFGQPERVYSLGGNSERWLTRTFDDATEEQMQETHYVTANIFSESSVPGEVECTELWKTHFDESISTVPPRAVTNAAVRIGRESSPERLLVHYIQPHLPPVAENLDLDLNLDFRDGWGANNPWRAIERGDVDSSVVKKAYRRNLSPVVDEVNLLLDNLSADDVVITADHGNMLGEMGRWGHFRANSIHPGVRMVPWWEVSADDLQTLTTEDDAEQVESDSISRQEKLRALGYV